MKKHVVSRASLLGLLFLSFFVTSSWAQNVSSEESICEKVDVMPIPPGGDIPSLIKWIAENLQYPKEVAKKGVQGKVVVQFIVEKDGTVSHATILRSLDPSLDKEALRVVNLMPRWTPGYKNEKPVRTKFALPISFKIS